MGLPDSGIGDVTYTSGTSVLRGNKSFSISMRFADPDGSFNNGSFKVSDIGGYEIDLDAQEETDDVTEFYINIPSFKFKFFSEMTDGTTGSGFDFGNILKSLSFINLCEITITYDGASDIFLCQKSDFTYNRSKREVSCKCYHPLKYSDDFGDIALSTFDPDSYTVAARYDDGSTNDYAYSVLTYRDLIKSYLEASSSSPTLRIQSSFTLTQGNIDDLLTVGAIPDDYIDATIFTTDTSSFATVEGAGSSFYIDSIETARRRVIEGAIAEGAIVGNMFQEAFYVRRDYTGADSAFKASLEASDFEEFEIDFFTSTVKRLEVNVSNAQSGTNVNVTNPQDITITVPQFGSQGRLHETDGTTPLEIRLFLSGGGNAFQGDGEVLESTLAADALTTYQYVTGSIDTVRWSGTILGIDKLKPYQYAELNTNINEYLDSSNNKIRFSSLKYNLKEDKIEFEAYSI